MSVRDDQTESSGRWPAKIEFTDAPSSGNPVVMFILLGGMLAGLAIAIWHLIGV
jgi:hypothetical protein